MVKEEVIKYIINNVIVKLETLQIRIEKVYPSDKLLSLEVSDIIKIIMLLED